MEKLKKIIHLLLKN